MEDMEQRREILTSHARVITKEGHMGVQSRDEVKGIIYQQFGVRKHEFFVQLLTAKIDKAMVIGRTCSTGLTSRPN
jgi:chlorite dismutase